MKKIIYALALAVSFTCSTVVAQNNSDIDLEDLQTALDMLRSDKNSYKIAVINKVMKLTPEEAEVFWPIYQEYEKKLAEISQRRIELIKEFVTNHSNGTLVNKTANTIAKQSLDIVQDRLNLWKKYHKKISRATTPIRGAQFLQIEHQIALFIDINISSEMPVVEPPQKN